MAAKKSSFAQLKRNSKSSIDKLTQELTKLDSPRAGQDDRFWYPEVDKAGNGYAVIRFLPAPEGEDLPFIRYWHHAFKGPTGIWYIENSLTTLGQNDPVSEMNQQLWATGLESNKTIVRQRKRNLSYVSNILVIEDPARPENNGKVFLFRYGKKLFDKINEAMNPEFADEEAMNPFDLWEGANFKLKIRKVEGYRNYDKSEFDKPSALSDDDSYLEEIWKQEYPLSPFLDPKNYKPYEQLQAQLNKVLGKSAGATAAAASLPEASSDSGEEDDTPWSDSTHAISKPIDGGDGEDGDVSLDYFQNLVDED